MITTEVPLTARLTITPDPSLLRLVRLAASSFALLEELDIDAVESVRIGADELVASLIEAGTTGEVTIEFAATTSALVITVTAPDAPAGFAPDPLSARLLEAMSSRSGWSHVDGATIGFAEWDLPPAALTDEAAPRGDRGSWTLVYRQRACRGNALRMLLPIVALIIAIVGVVQLLEGQILFGIVLLVLACAVGPGGYSIFRGRKA